MNADPACTAPLALRVNGVAHLVEGPIDLAALIERLGHPPGSVAVAVNERFVPRGLRSTCLLSSGDRIACFQPIVGG